jgi:hypothetical protein
LKKLVKPIGTGFPDRQCAKYCEKYAKMTEENRNDGIPIALAQEIARQGEARLTAIMALATAADLRATTLRGFFGASSVAVAAAVLASIASGRGSLDLSLAGGIVAFGLFLAALIAAHAGAPRDLFIAGGNPDILREWSWHAGKWRSQVEMLDATACRYAASITANRQLLELGSKRINAALSVAGAALPIGILAFFLQTLI